MAAIRALADKLPTAIPAPLANAPVLAWLATLINKLPVVTVLELTVVVVPCTCRLPGIITVGVVIVKLLPDEVIELPPITILPAVTVLPVILVPLA